MEKQRARDQKVQLLTAAQKEKDVENVTFKPKINQNYKVHLSQRPKSANSFILRILNTKQNKNELEKCDRNVHNRLINWGK